MKKIVLFILLITSIKTTFAQEFLGLRQSNYSGIMGADLNPASIADNRLKFDLLLFGGHFGAYNNHLAFNTKQMPHWWINSFNDSDAAAENWFDNSDFQKIVSIDSTESFKSRGLGQLFEINDGSKNRSFFINMEFDVLNFMITLNRKRAIGFQIKNRTIFNLDNISPELIRLASNDFNFPNIYNLNIKEEKFNISANSWMEYNFSYAQVISNKNAHFFKAGGKVKFLKGISAAYLYSTDLNFNIKDDSTANSITGNFDYGYSNNMSGLIGDVASRGQTSSSNTGKTTSKLGLGLDIGVVYEWRPNWKKYKYDMDGETDLLMRDKNKYKLKVGLALNDIGGMKYQKSGESGNFNINVTNFDLHLLDETNGVFSLDSSLLSLSDSNFVKFSSSDDNEFYMNLPTHLNLDVDYNIYKNFYANFYTRINMKFGNDKNTVSYPTSYAVTPRFDHKKWGVSLPISYNKIAGFRTGLALRMFNYLSVGTGDLKPLIAPGRDMDIRGLDVFFTLRMPILFKAPKDRDKDKVSDKMDKCIDIPGSWALLGCSDSDNDGVLDQNDSCVTDSGLVKLNGCPDRDGDDIIDKKDECPDTPGISELNGCPDSDNDGLTDKKDKCPTFPGPKENKGCPYKFLHTINELGEILETDTMFYNESIFHFENLNSEANYLFMLEEEDASDLIRVVIGNDTLSIRKNKLGYFKHLATSRILIDLMEEEEEVLQKAFDNLEFETGKAIIKKSSYESLESLAMLLITRPKWRLKVSGHTDDVGTDSKNLKISKNRAEAVANFLIANNILKDRITIEWFGKTNPIATNETKDGRQKNRRVEMKIE